FMRHVVMNGDNVDAPAAKAPKHRLQFVLAHTEIAIHDRVIVGARKPGPSVDAHLLRHRAATRHLRLASDDDFEHAVVRLTLDAENIFNCFAAYGICGWRERITENSHRRWMSCANFLLLCQSCLHSARELLDCAFAADMHEIN